MTALILVVLLQPAPNCDQPQPIKMGEVARCAGAVWQPKHEAGLLKKIGGLEIQIEAERAVTARWREASDAQTQFFASTLADRASRFAASQAECLAKIAAAAPPEPAPWYERPVFVVPATVAITAGLIFGGMRVLR